MVPSQVPKAIGKCGHGASASVGTERSRGHSRSLARAFELKFCTLNLYIILDIPAKFQAKIRSFRFFTIFRVTDRSRGPGDSSGHLLGLKICRQHIYIILGVPAKFQPQIPSITCFMKCPHFEHANGWCWKSSKVSLAL